jgi:hypothetical protein
MATLEKHHYLTYEEWADKYDIVEDEYGMHNAFDTHDDWEYIKKLDPHTVWTFRDGDDGRGVITNGIGFVNRLEYYVSKKPWNEGEYIEVRW